MQPHSSSSSRLEAFSDGVFAIAITLLILEIKAPALGERPTSAALWTGLGQLWPSYLAYALAFISILIAWIGHHQLLNRAGQVSQRLMVANGLFLLTIAFLPFPTAVVAEHLRDASGSAAAAFYALANLLNCLSFWRLSEVLGALHPGEKTFYSSTRHDAALGAVWCLACAVLALFSPLLSLLLVAAMWAWWLRPQRMPSGASSF